MNQRFTLCAHFASYKFVVAAAALFCSGGIAVAGDLFPPSGAILPTNRVQLNEQVISLPFTISQSGSYLLTSSLTGVSGSDGITIDADDVTLDLNGFTLIGVGGSLDGIRVNGARSHITVTNGSVRGWGANGINAGSSDNARFEALSIGSSGIDGMVAGANSIVRDLSVSGNVGAGIHVGGVRNRVDGCHATGNGTGINVQGIENLIVRNSASGNGADFNIVAGNAYGPIVNVGGVGNITPIPGANHPWANFSTTCSSNVWCRDVDGDNFGDAGDTATGCTPLFGYVADCTDCDDANPARNPGASELCDGLDNDCDLIVDNGTSMCGVGEQCCSGVCTDVQSDSSNCGTCGTACGIGDACCNGACTDVQSDPSNCGVCFSSCVSGGICVSGACACPGGMTDCFGQCVDQNNNTSHCGWCGNSCGAGESCCGGSCINIGSDPSHCGGCGNACPGGNLCCNSACADVQSDPGNCGGCFNACPAGNLCCGASCADPQTDPSNCGACGTTCTLGQLCDSSSCCNLLTRPCTASSDCCTGVCAFGRCCQPSGVSCIVGAECCSTVCSFGRCD